MRERRQPPELCISRGRITLAFSQRLRKNIGALHQELPILNPAKQYLISGVPKAGKNLAYGRSTPAQRHVKQKDTMDLVTGMDVGAEIEVNEYGDLDELPLRLVGSRHRCPLFNMESGDT
ncbi:hypothetical protein E2320_000630 [Naja naja]|nr:hypothetical protein E2320_000630 [Naja naja]